MAEALVGGAALGALLGVLLEEIVKLVERTIHFNPVLADIKSHVEFLNSVIKRLNLVSDFLAFPENTDDLKQLINEGKKLILKCKVVESNNKLMKHPKAPFYTKKLRDFDAKLQRARERLLLQLSVKQIEKLAAMTNYYCTNCCSMGTSENNLASRLQSKLHFQFYHDKQLKGKIGPNLGDAVLGRVAEHIKAKNVSNNVKDNGVEEIIEERIKEWGLDRYGKTFHRTFETVAQEKLQNWFRCDLLTTTAHNNNFNPPRHLPGVLYVSTAKLAFCSKKYTTTHPHHAESLYLKVIIPFQLLKAVKSSDQDQHIQLISIDDQEFQFVNFRNFTGANKCLLQIPATPPRTCNRCGI